MAEHEHDHEHEGEYEHDPVGSEDGEPVASDDEERELERRARRVVALARIRQYGDPALRMRAREVDAFDEDLARLVERMTSLMHEAQGVGLAATQVGVLRRLFVFVHEDEDRVLVNPVVTSRSEETDVDDEGCLSLRDVLVPVQRPRAVTIEGADAAGAPVRLELE